MKTKKGRWFTVVGRCEEQRHAYHVRAKDAAAAEKQVAGDGENCCLNMEFAGVFAGRRKALDVDPKKLPTRCPKCCWANVAADNIWSGGWVKTAYMHCRGCGHDWRETRP